MKNILLASLLLLVVGSVACGGTHARLRAVPEEPARTAPPAENLHDLELLNGNPKC